VADDQVCLAGEQRACGGRSRRGRGTIAAVDPEEPEPDLDAIGTDLADVEIALARLDDGSYWVDELTGKPLPEATLTARPTARRADIADTADGHPA